MAGLTGEETLSAREAAERLGIKRQTLYAYASRGLLHSLPGAEGRQRRYRRSEVEALRRARETRGPAAGAARALHFGEPVLESGITRLDASGPHYRGHEAVDLARRGASFESVAELLWTGHLPVSPPAWDEPAPAAETLPQAPAGATPLARLSLATAALGAADPGRYDPAPAAVQRRARTLIPVLAAAAGTAPEAAVAERSTARRLLASFGRSGARSAERALLERCLVVLADHELNASTFAARVVASTGADPYACLGAALAAASGPLHAGASESLEDFVAEIPEPAAAADAVHRRLRLGEAIPGFGHLLYPDGDPRVVPLLEAAEALAPDEPRGRIVAAIAAVMRAEGRPGPNVDAGLVTACAALDLPRGSGPAVFALGRTAGWVAHVLEQYERPGILRPRARYAGP